jgi:4-diphosphocytidyl-2-C-methyl-D-erythritol kinase
MTRARAHAKLNLALVVGPVRPDGKHEVATVLQAIDLCDDIELTPADALTVAGFPEDTLVRDALERLADAAGVATKWRVLIEKRIPVAAGLGGGSSDAATALWLANSSLAVPLPREELHALAAAIGADVPFFLREGPQLGTGDGADLATVTLPTDYVVLLVLPEGASKDSTASVYRRFDERDGAAGFEERQRELLRTLEHMSYAQDLAGLPRNDLASAPALQQELEALGAFRADVTGAGPVVYGLFDDSKVAEQAALALRGAGHTWLAHPVQRRMAR